MAGEDERFVVADVPGLVEGAHEGKGLGHRFLRHVSRCRALVLVVDLSTPDPAADLATVREELRAYDPSLATRPSLVVGTKLDLAPDVDVQSTLGSGAIAVSAVTGEGLDTLRERIASLAHEAAAAAEERSAYVVLRPARPRFVVKKEGERFRVIGRGVETLGVRDRPRGSREARSGSSGVWSRRGSSASSPPRAPGAATRS